MKISIQASAIRAAIICAAKKDIRYYLQGVYINVAHSENATVSGTDGHILFVGKAGIENLDSVPLEKFSLMIPLEIAKKIDKKASVVVLEMLQGGVYMIDGMRFDPIDGRFPDYMRVVPKLEFVEGEQKPSQFDYELLIRGNDALNAYYCKKGKTYDLIQRGRDSGVMHFGENAALVVIMPMNPFNLPYQGFNEAFPDPLRSTPILKAA